MWSQTWVFNISNPKVGDKQPVFQPQEKPDWTEASWSCEKKKTFSPQNLWRNVHVNVPGSFTKEFNKKTSNNSTGILRLPAPGIFWVPQISGEQLDDVNYQSYSLDIHTSWGLVFYVGFLGPYIFSGVWISKLLICFFKFVWGFMINDSPCTPETHQSNTEGVPDFQIIIFQTEELLDKFISTHEWLISWVNQSSRPALATHVPKAPSNRRELAMESLTSAQHTSVVPPIPSLRWSFRKGQKASSIRCWWFW